jgi:hypothetical protein
MMSQAFNTERIQNIQYSKNRRDVIKTNGTKWDTKAIQEGEPFTYKRLMIHASVGLISSPNNDFRVP